MALKYPGSGHLGGGHIPAKNGTMDDPLGTMGPLGPMVGVPVGNGGSSHQNNAATRVKRQNHLLISLLMLSMLLLVIALISGAVIYLHCKSHSRFSHTHTRCLLKGLISAKFPWVFSYKSALQLIKDNVL